MIVLSALLKLLLPNRLGPICFVDTVQASWSRAWMRQTPLSTDVRLNGTLCISPKRKNLRHAAVERWRSIQDGLGRHLETCSFRRQMEASLGELESRGDGLSRLTATHMHTT